MERDWCFTAVLGLGSFFKGTEMRDFPKLHSVGMPAAPQAFFFFWQMLCKQGRLVCWLLGPCLISGLLPASRLLVGAGDV